MISSKEESSIFIDSPSSDLPFVAPNFQRFIKGKYNQGRKNVLSDFLKKKCKVLLRNKISKKAATRATRPSGKPAGKEDEKIVTNCHQIYLCFRKIIERYYEENKSRIFQPEEEKSTNYKRPYTLIEDVKLFLVIHMGNKDSSVFDDTDWFDDGFEAMIKNWGFDRSVESLRDRFKRFLKKMSMEDWRQVIHSIEKNGLDGGSLMFEGEKNKKSFIGVSFPGVEKPKQKRMASKQIKDLRGKLERRGEGEDW